VSLVALVSNRFFLALDCLLVRFTGYSLVSHVYGRAVGTGYLSSLLLTTTGARSGRRRRAVLPYYRDGERLVIVGSNGGSRRDPMWVWNLRAEPRARVHLARRSMEVTAHVAEGEERTRLWESITRGRGPYAAYQKRAHPRIIPVVVLALR